jgi:hypothetical protein
MSETRTIRRPAPRTMPLAPAPHDVTAPTRERMAVDLRDGQTLSAAELLRLLDQMRQELSHHLVGRPGAFVGYDGLTVLQGAVQGPGRVLVEARLTGLCDRLHDVEYVAVSVPPGAEDRAESDPLLVRGTGRTLHVDC